MREDALRRQARFPVASAERQDVANPIRVLIVVGQRLFREALGALLTREEGIEIVSATDHGIQAIDVVNRLRPNVVLIELTATGLDVIELIRMIRQTSPEARPLMLAEDETVIFKALKAGAKGYVSNNASVSDLRKAIEGVHQGDLWVERKLVAGFLEGSAFVGDEGAARPQGALTAREHEVLRLLTSGGRNKDIAHALLVSEKTVKAHLNNIFRKLNVTRRLQAVLYAIERGLR